MGLIDGLLQELDQEAQTTRRVLERVPNDKLTWRPQAIRSGPVPVFVEVRIVPRRKML